MNDCLFCRIVSGDIPSAKVYEDDFCFAFRDINPQAPIHILVVPKLHVPDIAHIGDLPAGTADALMAAIGRIAAQEGLESGFRVVSNCGPDACQSVPHLHFHILGGRKMADTMA